MRLTCPRCAAQYQIADAAIPPAGREVECSACGHVWHQDGPGKAAPEPGFDAQARPVLNRALDESVLSILREEAARELRVRKGEPAEAGADHIPATGAEAPLSPETPAPQTLAPPAPAPLPPASEMQPAAPADAPAPPIDWPATTLTETEAPRPTTATPRAPAPARSPAPKKPGAAPAEQAGTADAPAEPATAPDSPAASAPDTSPAPPVESAPATPAPPDWPEPALPALPDAAELAATLTRPALPEPSPAPPPEIEAARTALRPASTDPRDERDAAPVPVVLADDRPRSGYGAGFGLAAMLALGLIAVYALAPQIPADRGGATLAEWRQGIDRGRLWLHDRILGD